MGWTDENWSRFVRVLNGTPPNEDAANELKVGGYVIGLAYGDLAWNENGWYDGWISLAKLSKDKNAITDIYGEIISDVAPLKGGFKDNL
ncbi:MAG: hypothetical protein DRN61_06995 [Thaumarchaeota archaeon]|nr:MAG: hypothetical protein DRN61_06995 [Nitrososphaerota archaeon]